MCLARIGEVTDAAGQRRREGGAQSRERKSPSDHGAIGRRSRQAMVSGEPGGLTLPGGCESVSPPRNKPPGFPFLLIPFAARILWQAVTASVTLDRTEADLDHHLVLTNRDDAGGWWGCRGG